MSDVIHLLPDSVANQIAAGEVIQRPASVIKELVENSVDAGAKRINILIQDGGRTSIQVIDDGRGMSVTDARLAFDRHATSKIRKADDLFSLTTMGFRGEALPSIASVAQVTLTTRQADDVVGTCLQISGGKFVSQEPQPCPVGCNFLVENLFFNVPARRRFLKKDVTETNQIISAFQRIALVYPEIAFTLHNNNQELFNLRATTLRQRIVDIMGTRLNQDLLPLEADTTICGIKGFVGKPESAKKKCTQQFFFVNGRFMKHAYFAKAVQNVYERMVPNGEQVPYFIYFTMNPEDIDVNIHPTKTEIKFHDEQSVWQILSATVREAVGKFSEIPSIDFDTEGKPDIAVIDVNSGISNPFVDFNPMYNPFDVEKKKGNGASKVTERHTFDSGRLVNSDVQQNWEELYRGLDITHGTEAETPDIQPSLFNDEQMMEMAEQTNELFADRSASCYQYRGSYIMTGVGGGLLVVDQERAHERILFERYMKRMRNGNGSSQKLLFPEMVQFTVSDMVHLPDILPEMEALGFELTNLGGGSYAVNSVPAGFEGADVVRLVTEMVASACEATSNMREELYSSLATVMARNTAIPHGQVLSNDEMNNIITELSRCDNYRYTPSGKSILRLIPHNTLIV